MFTIWIDNILVETIELDFTFAVAIAKKLSSEYKGKIISIRENGTEIFKKFIPEE